MEFNIAIIQVTKDKTSCHGRVNSQLNIRRHPMILPYAACYFMKNIIHYTTLNSLLSNYKVALGNGVKENHDEIVFNFLQKDITYMINNW